MSQYQRLISYLYRYEEGMKKENKGYARIELRGEICRVTVHIQENLSKLSSTLPEVFLFIQREWGMERIWAGQMRENGNSYSCRFETRTENMLGSGKNFTDLDGLMLYLKDDLFYATTWKDITVMLGEQEVELAVAETKEEKKEEIKEEMEQSQETDILKRDDSSHGVDIQSRKVEWNEPEYQKEIENTVDVDVQNERKVEANCQQCDCQQCPQKRRNVDFGSHILSVFPKMYPFEIENMGECVRLELKDMGCLPVEYWSLAGNPFLLHGYYCYRHIIFTRTPSRKYCVGVPGIFSQENQKKAEECGFYQFQSLSNVKDLHGAFGYWLYSIEN